MTPKNSSLDTALHRIALPCLSSMLVMGGATLMGSTSPATAANGATATGAKASAKVPIVAKSVAKAGKATNGTAEIDVKKFPAKNDADKAIPVKTAAAKTPAVKISDEEVAARLALTRARQLKAQGADSLAERQLMNALRLIPGWMPAQSELAALYSSQERWIEAAATWRKVLGSMPLPKRAKSEAKQQFERARSHLSAFWDTRDVVELGSDSQNLNSDADRIALAPLDADDSWPTSSIQPTDGGQSTDGEQSTNGDQTTGDSQPTGLTIMRSLAKSQPRLGAPYRAGAAPAVPLLPSIPAPQPLLNPARQTMGADKKVGAPVDRETARQRQIAIARQAGALPPGMMAAATPLKKAKHKAAAAAPTASTISTASLAPAILKGKTMPRRTGLVAAPVSTNRSPQTPTERQVAAKLALARGRQLAAQNADVLALAQFERAIALTPSSMEAHLTLARWQSKTSATYQEWGAAMQTWRRVLFLQSKAGKKLSAAKLETALVKEANREFQRARMQQSALWNAYLAGSARGITDFGQSSENLLSSTGLPSLRSLAKLAPANSALVNSRNASMQSALAKVSVAEAPAKKPTESFVFSVTLPGSAESAAAQAATISLTPVVPEFKKVEEVEAVDNPKLVDNSEK